MARNAPIPGCFTSLVQEFQDIPELQGLAPQPPSPLPRRSGIQAACPRAEETLAALVLLSATWVSTGNSRLGPVHHRSDELPQEGGEFRAVLPHPQPEVCDYLWEERVALRGTDMLLRWGARTTAAPYICHLGSPGSGMHKAQGRLGGVQEQHLVIPTSARVQLPRSFADELLGAEGGRGSWSAQAGPGSSQPCHLPSLPLGPAISAEATCSEIQPAGNRRMVLMLQGAMGEGEGGGQVDSRGHTFRRRSLAV